MMIHFRGCTNLMTTMFFIFFLLGPVAMATGLENPLVELSTRDDLIRLAGYGEERLSTVVVGGTVLCDACLDRTSHLHSLPIHGASVAVSCHTGRKTRKFNWVRGTSDQYGDFLIDLPSHLHAIPNMDKRCVVRILQLPKKSPCRRAFIGKHTGVKLSSSENGIRRYTTNEIHLTQKHSQPCMNLRSRGKRTLHML